MFDLKRFRKDNNLSQTELAVILKCGQPNISALERDYKDLTKEQMSILTGKYGDLSSYNIEEQYDEDFIPTKESDNTFWENLVNDQQASIKKLTDLLEMEQLKTSKLIDTINVLSKSLTIQKAM